MVGLTQIEATRGREDQLEASIRDRLADLDSGKYRQNNAYVLRLFAEWLRRDQGVDRVDDIDPRHLRQFSRALREAISDPDSDIETGSTANQYYDYVSAWLGWAVRDEYLDRNPARTETATEPLPEVASEPDRQFWSPREREAICATTDRLVDDTLDDPDASERDRLTAFRDRALVYMLGYTGCRGAELAAVRNDPRRDGLRWRDLDLAGGIVAVFGKTREWQEAPIFEPAIEPLRRWKRVLVPAEEDWPVFPTNHLPSLYNSVPDGTDPSPSSIWDDLRAHDVRPPSLTVDGVRRILRTHCEGSAYEFDEELKPHGARRGLGDQLYREQAELAQDVLRHKNIRTTHESYSEERTREVKRRGDEILD